jgi:hypothetical protein
MMRSEHENKSVRGRRQHGLAAIEIQQRADANQCAQQSDGPNIGQLDECDNTLAQAAFIAKMNRKRDER